MPLTIFEGCVAADSGELGLPDPRRHHRVSRANMLLPFLRQPRVAPDGVEHNPHVARHLRGVDGVHLRLPMADLDTKDKCDTMAGELEKLVELVEVGSGLVEVETGLDGTLCQTDPSQAGLPIAGISLQTVADLL